MRSSLFIFLLISAFVSAQPNFPGPGELYRDDVVARIDILIHPDSLEWIYENVESDHEFKATFIFNNGSIHDTIQEIGFRLRGNTSRYSKKKSFNVSFNAFNPGRKYQGVEKLNLNGEHNDPSIVRAKLCWDMLRKLNVPAPHANHVEVYINGDYYGLYINVEHIDEEFVKSRFGNNSGNLYKCLWPADLTYLGEDPENYKFMAGDRRAYQLTINEETDDYTDLRDFIHILQFAPDAEFKCQIDRYFNVYDYLKVVAFDVLTSNWDGYIYNKNNFYLYHNAATDKFEYMPYDVDNTFGIDWFNIDWGTRNIYHWGHSEPRPLYDRLMDIPEFRNQYSYYMKYMLDSVFDPVIMGPKIDGIKQQIIPYVADDPYYPQDYGYTMADFLNSYNQALGGHVKYGLKPYIQTRYDAAQDQLALQDIVPVINYVKVSSGGLSKPVIFSAFVEDDNSLESVEALVTINMVGNEVLDLFDDGLHLDGDAGDRIWGNSLAGFDEPAQVQFQIRAQDVSSHTSTLPCTPLLENIGFPPLLILVINEFMASNASTVTDESGEYTDWIEIYNSSDGPVWLGDKYLSDDLDFPAKWQFPNATLMPGGFLLIWADDEQEQGPYHVNFKLDKEGEEIGMFDSESTGYALIDSVTFGPQETDISAGRANDGFQQWKFFEPATPGYTNSSAGEDEHVRQDGLVVFPNPCQGEIVYFSQVIDISLYDIYGRLILERNGTDRIEVGNLPQGLYFIKSSAGIARKILIN